LTRQRSINETKKKKIEWLEKAYKDPYGVLFATIYKKEVEDENAALLKLDQLRELELITKVEADLKLAIYGSDSKSSGSVEGGQVKEKY